MNTIQPYIRTYTGRRFPVTGDPEQVDILDIAHVLSVEPRWGGHTARPYPVAAHCIFVSKIVEDPKFKLQALLHDASEAYICDLPSPFKVLLPDYKKVENDIMLAVAARFRLPWPLDHSVKQADAIALYLERLHTFDLPVWDDVPQALPVLSSQKEAIEGWDWKYWSAMSPKTLEWEFLKQFDILNYANPR